MTITDRIREILGRHLWGEHKILIGGGQLDTLVAEIVAAARPDDDRELVATMASRIAAGIEANTDCTEWEPTDVAARAVEVADAILDRIDEEPEVEASSDPLAIGVEVIP